MQLVNIQRLERMHDLILRKATGTPDEFARKLDISKSMLMINLAQLKQRGGPIVYNITNQTYCYTKPCRLFFGYELGKDALDKVKGGKNSFENFLHSNHIRMRFTMFAVQGFES